jgi:hypothetical protein
MGLTLGTIVSSLEEGFGLTKAEIDNLEINYMTRPTFGSKIGRIEFVSSEGAHGYTLLYKEKDTTTTKELEQRRNKFQKRFTDVGCQTANYDPAHGRVIGFKWTDKNRGRN